MFSDTVFEALSDILKDLRPDYAYASIYPKEVIIETIAMMYYCVQLSDSRMPDGSIADNHTMESLKLASHEWATETYEEKMQKGCN